MNVLDLGAAPGSWLQFVREVVGDNSKLVGVDTTDIQGIGKSIVTLQINIFDEKIESVIREKCAKRFDVILSDLAPKTSGVKEVDHYRSIELGERVLELACELLALKGSLVIKVFQGSDMDDFLRKVKQAFKKVSVFKPKACRDRSFEVYIIASNYRG